LEIGKGRIVRQGTDVAILSYGGRLHEALKAADTLAEQGITATVADARFAKPLDEELIRKLAAGHKALITIEEGSRGGFGAFVLEFLANNDLLGELKLRTLTLPDIFQDQDAPEKQYAEAGLTAQGIVKTITTIISGK
ncbi:MAG TPA: transketolase C-terminal domain-containing protein, partial [Alphaproteobacteria bacterium]|nr:transketolase C-terminal domain-containing protein [Alphaproteobacteria bacterium]